jgi:catechol 2,3-dioxygenase-like lactoylglutathione lyase family enzyme
MDSSPRIAGLGHVGIFVNDLDRSRAFDRDVLGLTVTDNDEANGMIFLSSRPDEEHHEFLICRGPYIAAFSTAARLADVNGSRFA